VSESHPSAANRLRGGFANAIGRLNDGTARAVFVIAVDQHGQSCAIWSAGDIATCGQIGEAMRHILYTPRTESVPEVDDVSRETSEKPEVDQGYKPKVAVVFDDRVGQPSGNLEQDLCDRIYRQRPDSPPPEAA
jgi:hypothetical protein